MTGREQQQGNQTRRTGIKPTKLNMNHRPKLKPRTPFFAEHNPLLQDELGGSGGGGDAVPSEMGDLQEDRWRRRRQAPGFWPERRTAQRKSSRFIRTEVKVLLDQSELASPPPALRREEIRSLKEMPHANVDVKLKQEVKKKTTHKSLFLVHTQTHTPGEKQVSKGNLKRLSQGSFFVAA